jgi:acyl dehydratase
MTDLATVHVGDRLPTHRFTIDRLDLVRYCGASGDFNVIHWSDRAAEAAGLPDVIAHGMLTMARSVNGVVAWAGDPAAVVEYGVRFVRPVVVPVDGSDTVTVEAEVVERIDEHTVRIALDVRVGDDAVLGKAEAVVRR